MSALENEATDTPNTFEHFGRTWTLPSSVRLKAMRVMAAQPGNLGIVNALLDAEQNAALDEIDPDLDELDKFTDKIAAAMGTRSSGNS